MLPRTEPMTYAGAAVATLYASHQRPIFLHLRRLVSDHEAAEDLCQETFIKALRCWHTHDPQASEAAWLYRIATNTAYDFLRRRRRVRFSALDDADAVQCRVESPEAQLGEQEPVQHALTQIPPIYRLPLVLHTCNGHSTQEIADALGCSTSAVKTRLFRARARFRDVYRA